MSTSALGSGLRTYDFDPAHTNVHFSVRHMMISNVRGEFTSVKGTVLFDPNNLQASKVEAEIDASSIHTREPQRDAHLKSPDFLDIAKYPQITFRSTKIERDGEGFRIEGDLTIHGTTRPVVLQVEDVTPEMTDPWGATRLGATARTKIKRSDFGLTWNQVLEAGGLLVGDDISITHDVELVRRPS